MSSSDNEQEQILSIVQNLINGGSIKLTDGRKLAMGKNYAIGYLMSNITTGEKLVVGSLGLDIIHRYIKKGIIQ